MFGIVISMVKGLGKLSQIKSNHVQFVAANSSVGGRSADGKRVLEFEPPVRHIMLESGPI